MLGAAFLLWGFMKAGTLKKGALAKKEEAIAKGDIEKSKEKNENQLN
jgi:hypothetical protein